MHVFSATENFYTPFGDEKNAELIGRSGLWVKTPLNTIETPLGKAQAQVIYRYFGGHATFKLGSITYYSFPRHKEKAKQDTLDIIRKNIQKLYPDKDLYEEKIADNIWAFSSDWGKGSHFLRVFYFRGEKTYTIVTRLMKNRYMESTNMEAEWIQRILLKRADWFDKHGQEQKTTFNFSFSLIDSAYAQGNNNCPPPGPGGTLTPAACGSPANCAAMLNPVNRTNCYAVIQDCQMNTMNAQMGTLNNTMAGSRGDINCQSAFWSQKVDQLTAWGDGKQAWADGKEAYIDGKQAWVDGKQVYIDGKQVWIDGKLAWVDQRVLPMANDINGTVNRGIDFGEKITSAGYVAAVTAAGAAAATIASAGANLLIEGISSGVGALFGVISGSSEEERRRKEAAAFLEAKNQWEDLETKIKELEEGLAASVDIFGLVSGTNKSLENLIAETDERKEDKEFKLDNLKHRYEKLREETGTKENLACRREIFGDMKSLEKEIAALGAIAGSLELANEKHGSMKNLCNGLASDISRLLEKEVLLEKLRNKLSSYYASYLWVEQQELEQTNKERLTTSSPEALRDTELKTAVEKFYSETVEPTRDPNLGTKYNCKSVIDDAHGKCRSEKHGWPGSLPFIGPLFGAKRGWKECSAIQVGLLINGATVTSPKRNPAGFKQLAEFYEQKFASKDVYGMGFDNNELLCIKGLVNNYNLYRNQVDRAHRNYKEAIRTWNYRRSQAAFEDEFNRDLSGLVRDWNLESACGNIEREDCLDSDETCQQMAAKECVLSQEQIVCANIPNEKYCNGMITKACKVKKGQKRDSSDYCKYQYEEKARCEENLKTCQKKNIPIGCAKMDEESCADKCVDIEKSCKSTSKAKGNPYSKDLCSYAKSCQEERKQCLDKKRQCSKAAFSNIRFRFGRLKGMRDYLQNNSCKQFQKSSIK